MSLSGKRPCMAMRYSMQKRQEQVGSASPPPQLKSTAKRYIVPLKLSSAIGEKRVIFQSREAAPCACSAEMKK